MVGSRADSAAGGGAGRSSAQRQRNSTSGGRVGASAPQRRAPGLAQGAALGAAAAALRRCVCV